MAGTLVIVGLYMHYLVLRMSKRDETLLNCLLPDFALNFLVGGPAMYIISSIILVLPDPANEMFGIWFCHMASILGYVWLFKVWLFSLLVAILRYLYVVHNEKIQEYGLARVQRIFRILFWAIPTGLMILHLAFRTDHEPTILANRCYGWSLESSSSTNWWYTVKQKFCFYRDYGFTNRFAEYGLKMGCGVNQFVRILLLSNLPEGVIYYRVHKHLKT